MWTKNAHCEKKKSSLSVVNTEMCFFSLLLYVIFKACVLLEVQVFSDCCWRNTLHTRGALTARWSTGDERGRERDIDRRSHSRLPCTNFVRVECCCLINLDCPQMDVTGCWLETVCICLYLSATHFQSFFHSLGFLRFVNKIVDRWRVTWRHSDHKTWVIQRYRCRSVSF